jgi:cytidylate kinase
MDASWACERYLKGNRLSAEDLRAAEPKTRPFVTLSRQAGAGGITVGRLLVEYLNDHDKKAHGLWRLFDKELLSKVVEENGYPERFADYMKEDAARTIEETFEEILNLHPSDWLLVRKTSQTIRHLAEAGHVILVGRGGNLVTRGMPGGFHARLIGSREKRVRHIQAYYGFSVKTAEEFVKKEDEGRRHYFAHYFNKDINDPLLYDTVINTDLISYAETAAMIGRAALSPERYPERPELAPMEVYRF